MLDLKFLRDHTEAAKQGLARKGLPAAALDELIALDEKRRKLLIESEELKAARNRANDEISKLKAAGKPVLEIIDKMKSISQKIAVFDQEVDGINRQIEEKLIVIPNLPDQSTPDGKSPSENQIKRTWGSAPQFDFKPKDHLELAAQLGWISFERASKIAGSGFAFFEGEGAHLVRALINFMVDLHVKKHGYKEVWPPVLVNRQSMTGTGQLPKMEEDMYRLKDEDYFLIPTAEVPVSNMHRGETLNESDLPLKYVAYTPCFRREAGSYGKDTKGLSRVHQFDKVELVKFVKPGTALDELETLVGDAEEILQQLEIPYRVTLLCAGDLSFAGAKCYDLEAFAPGTNRWFEVSSCSAFFDFQARRMNVKYRPQSGGKAEYVHTLNGSGVALARTIICLLENHQQADGTVRLPKALDRYLA